MIDAKSFFYIFLLLMVTGCSSMFEYSPNQVILEEHEKNLTQKNIDRILQTSPGDTIRFILISDTQRFYDETEDFVEHANTLSGISFVLHGGDISDFGLVRELRWVNHCLSRLKMPYLTVVGNHDLVGNGAEAYKAMFGELNYSFVYGNYKFIFLNTNSREYRFNGNVPDLDWLRKELHTDEVVSRERDRREPVETFKQAIVLSHVPPFDGDFDPQKEREYARIIKNSGKVRFSLHGHQHRYSKLQPYHDGITYLTADSMDKRNYMLIKVWSRGYSLKRIFY